MAGTFDTGIFDVGIFDHDALVEGAATIVQAGQTVASAGRVLVGGVSALSQAGQTAVVTIVVSQAAFLSAVQGNNTVMASAIVRGWLPSNSGETDVWSPVTAGGPTWTPAGATASTWTPIVPT